MITDKIIKQWRKNYNIEYQKYMTVINVLCEISDLIELKKYKISEDLRIYWKIITRIV